MSTLGQHLQAICALMRSVPTAGVVHDEEPLGRTEAEFQQLYLWRAGFEQRELRGWWVRRTATDERIVTNGSVYQRHTWLIRGFSTLDTARRTGTAWQECIEALRDAFRADPTLGGAANPGPLGDQSGLQVRDVNTVLFAGVLCHSAQLQLQTHDYVTL